MVDLADGLSGSGPSGRLPAGPVSEPCQLARSLVAAIREGFTVLAARGSMVTPGNLRAIFGRVPVPITAAYWAIQLSRPM